MPKLDLAQPDAPDPSRNLKILLAEDNKVNQMLLLKQLQKCGYQADVVGDGEAVLAALGQRSYDVILMDVQMAPMDGLTASLRIQHTIPPDQRPYIIALTAHDMHGDHQRCLDAGMQDYLTKPLRGGDLVQALQRAATQCCPEPPTIADPVTPSPAAPPPKWSNLPDLDQINALPVLDQEILNGIRHLAGEAQAASLLKVLATQYLEDAPTYLAAITDALTAQDATQLARAAHGLRSSSANLGGTQLAHLCKIVETLGRSQQLQVAQPYQQPLHDLAQVFQNALRENLL